jgi:ABC-type xylose transport system permease subunit
MEQYTIYYEKLISVSGIGCGTLIAAVNFWIFPEDTLMFAAVSVLMAMIIDVVTKYRSLSKQHGGYRKARKAQAITSQKFWKGTSIKLYTYAVIVILAGLSYRVTALDVIGTVFSSVAYGAMFWREVQSIGENLEAAGGDAGWMKAFARRKEKEILNYDNSVENPEEGSEI